MDNPDDEQSRRTGWERNEAQDRILEELMRLVENKNFTGSLSSLMDQYMTLAVETPLFDYIQHARMVEKATEAHSANVDSLMDTARSLVDRLDYISCGHSQSPAAREPSVAATSSSLRAATSSSNRAATSSSKRAATSSSKRAATSSSNRAATSSSKRAATSSSNRAATSSSNRAATSSSNRAATSSSNRAATSSSNRAATSSSNRAATSSSNRAATSSSNRAATSSSNRAATSSSSRAATSSSNRAATSSKYSVSTLSMLSTYCAHTAVEYHASRVAYSATKSPHVPITYGRNDPDGDEPSDGVTDTKAPKPPRYLDLQLSNRSRDEPVLEDCCLEYVMPRTMRKRRAPTPQSSTTISSDVSDSDVPDDDAPPNLQKDDLTISQEHLAVQPAEISDLEEEVEEEEEEEEDVRVIGHRVRSLPLSSPSSSPSPPPSSLSPPPSQYKGFRGWGPGGQVPEDDPPEIVSTVPRQSAVTPEYPSLPRRMTPDFSVNDLPDLPSSRSTTPSSGVTPPSSGVSSPTPPGSDFE